jgi:hypothetical protein
VALGFMLEAASALDLGQCGQAGILRTLSIWANGVGSI